MATSSSPGGDLPLAERVTWQQLLIDPELATILSDPVTVHRGAVPSCFLPSGGVDLILACGVPIPAPWKPVDFLLQTNRGRAVHIAAASAHAIRIPLEAGFYDALCGVPAPSDGLHPVALLITELLEASRSNDHEFDVKEALHRMRERVQDARRDRWKRFREAHEILEAARSDRIYSVRKWARRVGASLRTLQRTLEEGTGERPKHLLRIVRLNHALAALEGELCLAEAADRYRYADQSHFSRECRELTGLTPRQLQNLLKQGRVLARYSGPLSSSGTFAESTTGIERIVHPAERRGAELSGAASAR